MDLNSALSQIKLRNQNLELCSQLDIELLVLDILKISKNRLELELKAGTAQLEL